ncbi:lipopolysaccharide-induced tumor necrosis factor-alpha factor homolog [Hyalella azteca]|uniref:Lipopolysaccharide-induced tumor necrosis factor-alpha factor homolog n=1 Tax=Hyalella azteca TaxID=294128 RepID=A0A8B7N2W3_HYAAZ|nr:lipopolysaccharide-induced tumor necrosis factor-alpha factor homolog [Hyalella azteca]
MSKSNQAPIGFSAAPPPSAPPSYAQAMGGVPPQAPYYPQPAPPGVYGHPDTQQPFLKDQARPTIVTTIVPLGRQSTHMICPHCQAEINTATKTAPSRTAWLASLLICLLGCPLGCCLIPFCMDDCMNTEHNCPNCKAYLGQHARN